jgi:hypothetical protein
MQPCGCKPDAVSAAAVDIGVHYFMQVPNRAAGQLRGITSKAKRLGGETIGRSPKYHKHPALDPTLFSRMKNVVADVGQLIYRTHHESLHRT